MNSPVTMTDLKNKGQGAVAAKDNTFPALLQKSIGEIARALPKHITPDRMARIALTEFRKNPKLKDCNPLSICASVIVASQLGLEFGSGHAFLVPYGKECQMVPGWKGLVDLATRTGRATVDAQVVYEGDHFKYAKGTRPFIEHEESGNEPPDRDNFKFAYAVGWVKGSEFPKFEIWTRDRVIKHRDRYNRQGKAHYSFQHLEQYAKKVVLLQVLKYLPTSAELGYGIEITDAADKGYQHLNIDDAIDGVFVDTSTGEITQQPITEAQQVVQPIGKPDGVVTAAVKTQVAEPKATAASQAKFE